MGLVGNSSSDIDHSQGVSVYPLHITLTFFLAYFVNCCSDGRHSRHTRILCLTRAKGLVRSKSVMTKCKWLCMVIVHKDCITLRQDE